MKNKLFQLAALFFLFLYFDKFIVFGAEKSIIEDKNTIPPAYSPPSTYQSSSRDETTHTYQIDPQGKIGVIETQSAAQANSMPVDVQAGEHSTDITFKYKDGKPVEIEYKNADANIPSVSIEQVTPKVEAQVNVEAVKPQEESAVLKEGTSTAKKAEGMGQMTEETNSLTPVVKKEKTKIGEEKMPETTFVEGGIGIKEVTSQEDKKDLIEKETGKKLKESKTQQKQYVKRILGYAVSEEDVPWNIVQDMLYHEKEVKTNPEKEEFLSVPVDMVIRGEVQSVSNAQSKSMGLKSKEGVMYNLVGEAEEMLRGKEGSQAKITGRSVPDLNYKGKKIKVVEIVAIEETE